MKTAVLNMIKLFNGDCREIIKTSEFLKAVGNKQIVYVTDPPFNIGYHYKSYSDKMANDEYMTMLVEVFGEDPCVIIHYPEQMYKIAVRMGRTPDKVVSWVYNSNTAKQHRDIAFFGIKPDFRLVRQPYKNLKDKRIQERIKNGSVGGRLYDWWNVNQVKNISREKTAHPCQMPEEIMANIVGILPGKENIVIVDPFMGSGTTGVVCKKHNVDFIGIEIEKDYYDIARARTGEEKEPVCETDSHSHL